MKFIPDDQWEEFSDKDDDFELKPVILKKFDPRQDERLDPGVIENLESRLREDRNTPASAWLLLSMIKKHEADKQEEVMYHEVTWTEFIRDNPFSFILISALLGLFVVLLVVLALVADNVFLISPAAQEQFAIANACRQEFANTPLADIPGRCVRYFQR